MWGGFDILMARQPFLMAKQYDPQVSVAVLLPFLGCKDVPEADLS